MNKIHINDNPAMGSKELTPDQIRLFLASGKTEKLALVEMWVPGWRKYETWTITSDIPGWDGLNGSFISDPDPMPIADIPEDWMDQFKIKPGK